MIKNMGTVDRTLRALVAVTILVLYLTGILSGTAALVLGALAAVFFLTSLAGSCPGYLPFRFSTRGRPHQV